MSAGRCCPFRTSGPLPSRLDVVGAPTVRSFGSGGAGGGGGSGTPQSQALSACLEVDATGGPGGCPTIRYIGNGSGYYYRQAASLRTDLPVPSDCPLFYYEMTVMDGGDDGALGLGFSTSSVPLGRLPGWDDHSYGYHGDDGNKFSANGRGTLYGPRYGAGDVVGALWDRIWRVIEFFRNGESVGVAFANVPNSLALYPMIGLRTRGSKVSVNLGPHVPGGRPFKLDLRGREASARQAVLAGINAVRLPTSVPRVFDGARVGDSAPAGRSGTRSGGANLVMTVLRSGSADSDFPLDPLLDVPPPEWVREGRSLPTHVAAAHGGGGGGGGGGLLLGLVLEHLLCRGMAGTAAALAREAGGATGDVGGVISEPRLAAAALRQRVMADICAGRTLVALHHVETGFCGERCPWCGPAGGVADAAAVGGTGAAGAASAIDAGTDAAAAEGSGPILDLVLPFDGNEDEEEEEDEEDMVTAGAAAAAAAPPLAAAQLLHWRLRLQLFLGLVTGGAPYTALEFARRHLRQLAPPPVCTAWGLQQDVLSALQRNGEMAAVAASRAAAPPPAPSAAAAAESPPALWQVLGLLGPDELLHSAKWPPGDRAGSAVAGDGVYGAASPVAPVAQAGGGPQTVPIALCGKRPAAVASPAGARDVSSGPWGGGARAGRDGGDADAFGVAGLAGGLDLTPHADPDPRSARQMQTEGQHPNVWQGQRHPADLAAAAAAVGHCRGSGASSPLLERRPKLPRVNSPPPPERPTAVADNDENGGGGGGGGGGGEYMGAAAPSLAAGPATMPVVVTRLRHAVSSSSSGSTVSNDGCSSATSGGGGGSVTNSDDMDWGGDGGGRGGGAATTGGSGGGSPPVNDAAADVAHSGAWPRPAAMLRYHKMHERRRAAAKACGGGTRENDLTDLTDSLRGLLAGDGGGGSTVASVTASASASPSLPLHELHEALSLLAYTDPRVAPAARLLGPIARDTLADQLNEEMLRLEAAGWAAAAGAGGGAGDGAVAAAAAVPAGDGGSGGGLAVDAHAISCCAQGLGMLRVLDDEAAAAAAAAEGKRRTDEAVASGSRAAGAERAGASVQARPKPAGGGAKGGDGNICGDGGGGGGGGGGSRSSKGPLAAKVCGDRGAPGRSPLERLYCQCTAVWDELVGSCGCPETQLVGDWRKDMMAALRLELHHC